MAYESMGKDISEPKEVMDAPRPAKPKLKKPSPPPAEPKPPVLPKSIDKEMNCSTVNEAYHKLLKRKEFGHWDKKES